VSLQGSLDAFALPDVLALLASTKKSGELYVRGTRSEGRVWMDQGLVVGGEAPRARTLPEVFFELLRQEEGSFVFDPGAGVPDGEAVAVEPVLRDAQHRLSEWRSIETVVPSLSVRVRMVAHAPAPEVSVTAEQWEVLAVVAGGAPVDAVAQALTLGEFGACQVVKRLVDAGLVELEDATAGFAATAATSAGEIEHLVEIPKRRRRATDPAPEADVQEQEPETHIPTLADARAAREAQQRESEVASQADIDAAVAALSPEKAQALARELADLGTEAADAVEAAARASTPEERAEALKGVLTDEHGEPINRGLLLKFLSSVRS
jgi:hypothetical protein